MKGAQERSRTRNGPPGTEPTGARRGAGMRQRMARTFLGVLAPGSGGRPEFLAPTAH
ncbi:hypothetical protein KCH_66540 [Kitasatospora cheerisanensis KCTC 2395]|uniref:Uncharacterized protein n=1 Tax=Kitasatospora cheerisanensis KCTC 2395 TaxID=1348663 RepID=A0A066YU54_9ACTN|nr:hypothetical protein KCH_66540 [Kitasatospora cheerisanensis KCTC 2395]